MCGVEWESSQLCFLSHITYFVSRRCASLVISLCHLALNYALVW